MTYKKLLVTPILFASFSTAIFAEPVTDLHTWRLKDNSVKISFKDNTDGEFGYRFINDVTGEPMSSTFGSIDGVGTSGIAKLIGLNAGTEYAISIQTLMVDNPNPEVRIESTSEPILFRTTGEEEEVDEKLITELHAWRLKDTSVKISFKNGEVNGEKLSEHEYINTATNLVMKTTGSITNRAGTDNHIGKLIELNAGTTYDVMVCGYYNTSIRACSNPIPFTTKTNDIGIGTVGEGSAIDLHTWRLQNTSVKISFKDMAEGEAGFRFFDANTKVNIGNFTLSPLLGTGRSDILKINDLTPNTEYSVVVQTLFNDGRDPVISEPITFTTEP